jgi:hypothetical protein
VHLEKVICQNLLQISSIEEENPQFCTLFLHVTFLLANFSHFSQQFRNQRKILHFFETRIQIFRLYKPFFKALKPNSQETAQNFEKGVLQKFLRITFYTYIPMNPHHFLKKHHNRCTLMCTLPTYLNIATADR